MSIFPILETDRLVLRQLNQEDSQVLFEYFSLGEVIKYYDLDSFNEIKQAEQLIHNWNQRYENNQGIRWGITLKSENRLIGTCGFHNWMKEHYKAEIGYELNPKYWCNGIMTEAINEILEYGFEELELNRIEAFIDPENISSRKLLEKTGLKEEGLLKEVFYEKSQFVDAIIFAILKKNYKGK
ncbi:GNAT family N-acetyltransferase [Paenibacillus endoradicis]|uniref:GNAT family N-acetyltransferase n=1 Tax=Paenibacillus endoradicis TaxID=2972487 RepID=UPI002159ABF1|nr:GNAT family protein [Paenibacillus endoradicis]MCR8656232.1 GNAT family N-acetyltransferase [Paenibacillus endoradicis]